MSMGMYEDQTADFGDVAALGDAAREGRTAAMSRRRALAAGRSALAPAQERVHTAQVVELRAPTAVRSATPAAPAGDSALSGTHGAPAGPAVPINAVAAGRLGRALSMQRRRQLSQGKQALNGGGDRAATAAGAATRSFIVHRGGAS